MKTKLAKEDAVVVMSALHSEQDTLIDVLRRAFDCVGELAVERHMEPPLAIYLADADARCLLIMEMIADEHGWDGTCEGGELDTSDGLPLPWFVIAEDRNGRTLKIRVELDTQPHQIN